MCGLLIASTIAMSQAGSGFIGDVHHIIQKEKSVFPLSGKTDRNTIPDTYNWHYTRAYWEIDPGIRYIKGKIIHYFQPSTNPLDTLQFDLSGEMTVDSVQYHNTLVPFIHQSNHLLEIHIPSPTLAGISDSVSIFYQGIPDTGEFGGFVQSFHNTAPIIWTLSEPYGAMEWWPCKQSLTDKIDSIDIAISIPSGNKAASNGVLAKVDTMGNRVVYHWRHRYPITPYLVGLAVTNYEAYTDLLIDANDTISILNYVFPEKLAEAKVETPVILPIMKLFRQLFGEYPFADEKYGHAQFGFGGGMEHQTMSFMGDFSFGLMAHELAHQWFGNKITCDSWHDIWLNEGFATYLTGLAYENIEEGKYWGSWKQQTRDYVLSEPDGTVWVSDTTDVNRIFDGRLTYYKGAWVLHMLRWVMGDQSFFEAMYNYITDTSLVYGFAGTDDFINHVEAVSQEQMVWFFNDWVYAEGFPNFLLTWSQDENLEVKIILKQTTSHSSVSFFKLPIPVLLKGFNRDSLIIINHTFSGEEFIFYPGWKVMDLVFDPDLWLLAKHEVNRDFTQGYLIEYYPNPATDELLVEVHISLADQLVIELLDPLGRLVTARTFLPEEGYPVPVSLSTALLPRGVYFIRITINGLTWTGRWVKG